MDCKEYLQSYRTLKLNITRLEDRIAQEESQATRITTILSDMPRGGRGKFADDLWAKLADTKEEYKRKLTESLQKQKELEDFLDQIPGEMHRLILQMRYIDCLGWAKIAEVMGYEPRWVQHLHGLALNEARRLYERRDEGVDAIHDRV